MILILNGFQLNINRISTIELFSADIKYTQVQVPQFYIESQKIWMENTMHPDYINAKEVEIVEKNLCYFDFILRHSVDIDTKYLQESNWKEQYQLMLDIEDMVDDELNEKLLFLSTNVFLQEVDKNLLIDSICLTENRVGKIFMQLVVLRNGQSLYQYPLKNSVNTGIDYQQLTIGEFQLTNPIDEYNACVKSGMNWNKWIENKYSLDTMASTVALFRLSKLIEIHSEDAVNLESERKNKK